MEDGTNANTSHESEDLNTLITHIEFQELAKQIATLMRVWMTVSVTQINMEGALALSYIGALTKPSMTQGNSSDLHPLKRNERQQRSTKCHEMITKSNQLWYNRVRPLKS